MGKRSSSGLPLTSEGRIDWALVKREHAIASGLLVLHPVSPLDCSVAQQAAHGFDEGDLPGPAWDKDMERAFVEMCHADGISKLHSFFDME